MFPNLFTEYITPDGALRMQFEFGAQFPAHLTGLVKMVAYSGNHYLTILIEDGWWEPGGKLEPGETYLQTIQREMREETGAQVKDFTLFGALHCYSLLDGPPEPGLLWPEFYFLWGYGEVEIIGSPQPTAHEKIRAVALAPLEDTCRRLAQTPGAGPLLVDIYQLADQLRKDPHFGDEVSSQAGVRATGPERSKWAA